MNSVRLSALAKASPFLVWIAVMIIESGIKSQLPTFYQNNEAFFYPARVLATSLVLIYFWRHYVVDFLPWTKINSGQVFLSATVGVGVLVMWIIVGPLFRMGTPPTGVNPIPEGQTAGLVWLTFRFIGTAMVIPIIEELFWRSYLMRRIDGQPDVDTVDPKTISWLAIIVSSAVFAMEHKELLAGFLAGIAYALIYSRTNNLRTAIIAHSVTNAGLFIYVVGLKQFHFWN